VVDLPTSGGRRAGGAGRADALAVVGTFAEALRETLAVGTDRELLDGMLAGLSEALDYPAICVARAETDHLELVAAHGFPGPALPGGRISVRQGLVGDAFRSARPVRSDDTAADPRYVDVSEGRHRSSLAIPMRLADRVWGVLAVESTEPFAFDDHDVAVLSVLADQMGWAFESIRLRRIADERAERELRLRRGLEASAAVITAGLEATGTSSVPERMVREIRERFSWGGMFVALRRDDGRLEVVAAYASAGSEGVVLSEGRGIVGHVAMTGRPYLAKDVSSDPYYVAFHRETASEMCAPLTVSGRVVGVLDAQSDDEPFTEDDLEALAQLAEQMSLVIHNTELLASEKTTVARLHELDQLKSRLLSIASHELRTPLTVVMGFAEVLAEHVGTIPVEKAREYADAIARQATSLSHTVDQMLLAAQMEQGGLQVHTTGCELLAVVARALKGERGLHVEVLPGTDTRVVADPFRLQQVLEGLLDNAIKYAKDSGRIQLDARTLDDRVEILIRDEGPGIPRAEREAIFEVFHQVGEHGVAGRRGIGLGLAVSRDLLRLMGGDLALATAEGYGATFLLRLPAPTADARARSLTPDA
ncbi:MAG: GAF domain-containing sensor histidine kinase, partial [Actinobacteria bacterium]|nr:GAF domain-containing sensor histidine kinase [Actinomycetota bacterium]